MAASHAPAGIGQWICPIATYSEDSGNLGTGQFELGAAVNDRNHRITMQLPADVVEDALVEAELRPRGAVKCTVQASMYETGRLAVVAEIGRRQRPTIRLEGFLRAAPLELSDDDDDASDDDEAAAGTASGEAPAPVAGPRPAMVAPLLAHAATAVVQAPVAGSAPAAPANRSRSRSRGASRSA